MKDFDNIEDWYRDELNNYHVEPDKNGWDSIAENLDASTPITENNIEEWYKKEVSKLEERPDYTVWEKLSTKLDTASVWDKLSVSLDRYELFLWWRNMALRASAIVLLLTGSYLTYNNYSNNETIAKVKEELSNQEYGADFTALQSEKKLNNAVFLTKQNAQPTASSEKVKTTNLNKISKESNPPTVVAEAKSTLKSEILNGGSNDNNDPLFFASVKEIKNYHSLSIENLNPLKPNKTQEINTNLDINLITEKDIIPNYSNSEFLVKKDKNKILFNKKRFSSRSTYSIQTKRLYVGANMGFKKQGMISSIQENGALKAYSQSDLLDFGTNFGGVIGVVISRKLNIETNINFNSTSGYKRSFTAEGASFQENLNLNYTAISLLAKRMNNRSTFDNRIYSTNFFGGAYLSYLRTAASDVHGISRKLDDFSDTDYGIVLGIEQDRYISKTLVITPGVRYNQGLANIANENSPYAAARNFSFEFNLGVKYIFIKSGN